MSVSVLDEYLKSIALLEKRKTELLDGEIPGCKQDCLSRIALIENELDDLYAIVRYYIPYPPA